MLFGCEGGRERGRERERQGGGGVGERRWRGVEEGGGRGGKV